MLLSRMPDGEPEMFVTVQGEGVTAGTPSVFVRLAECNLRCGWCDTSYTWDWTRHDRAKATIDVDVDAIVARVRSLAGAAVRTVVVTGGEPLLQTDALVPLARALVAGGFRIEVETNGTIAPTPELGEQIAQWNVSPKLESSGNPLKARHRPSALAAFGASTSAFFKFVVTSRSDLEEIDGVVTALEVPRERVLLMPEGTDAETLRERSRWLADACIARGFRLGARQHVGIWGSERAR